jgi:hypothetical protein
MLITMFPQGAQFIDELSGSVYRVVNRRASADGMSATLTLNREVFREDMQNMNPSDPDSYYHRTVWVFPPAIDRSNAEPTFSGPSPVVSIDVRTMTLTPSS